MSETIIKIEGLEELKARLIRMPSAAARAVKRLAEAVKLEIVPYPPEGEYNQPGPYPKRWYQRHFGPRWARKRGGVGGRNTSENLQANWRIVEKDAWTAIVGTPVSYADYVVGENQADFHARHGWRKLSTVARWVIERNVVNYVNEEIRREIGGAL